MAINERCPDCGHIPPRGVKQRCIATGGYCAGADIASSSASSSPRAAGRKPAKKKAKR